MNRRKQTLAAVVAHPDDFAHAMGGTALLLSGQYDFRIFCFTSGQRGIPGKTAEEAGKIREAEETGAAAMAGGEVTFFREMDGELFAERSLCEQLAGEFSRCTPAAVFTLWPVNVPDHSAVSNICTSAMHLADIYYSSELYFIENGIGGQTNQFDPDIYVDISPVIEKKREMIRAHVSQNPDEESVERVVSRNIFRGRCARTEYAEGFKTVHTVNNRRWDRNAGSLLLEIG